ncbi:MAG TPA: ferritin-like domain-containing protein [Labilithrix sp.]
MSRKYTASDAVRHEWLRRVQAEYTSATVTQAFTLWLMQIAASPDLVRAGLRIAWDEMIHARMSHEAYVAAGGTDAPALDRDRLGLARSGEPLEHDVVRVAVNTFCIGETVAVPLFKNLRQHCTIPPARKVLDRVLRDEVRHRDFGWAVLGWLLELPQSEELRGVATRALPTFFERIRLSYGATLRHLAAIPDADRAWGLMPPAEYASIVERTLVRDWIPRFGSAGIDARRAWDASLSVASSA